MIYTKKYAWIRKTYADKNVWVRKIYTYKNMSGKGKRIRIKTDT